MKTKSLLVLTAAVALFFTACEEPPYINGPGNNAFNYDSIPVIVDPDPLPDPEGANVPEGCLNVYEACNLCKKLASGEISKEKYYIKGWVCELDSKNADGINTYGNATFYMTANNQEPYKITFEAYQVYGKDGKKFSDVNQVAVGDFVVIYGPVTNYNGTYETNGKGTAYVYYSTNEFFDPKEDPTKITPDPQGANVPQGCLNVYEAREICAGLAEGTQTPATYHVKGWIKKVVTSEADVTKYHNATFYITPTNDGSTANIDFEAYRIKSINGANFTSLNEFQVGDFVVIECKLKNYKGTYETGDNAKLYYSTNPNLKLGN